MTAAVLTLGRDTPNVWTLPILLPDQLPDVSDADPRRIDHRAAPCGLHTFHSPITVQNELHHPFSQYLQRRVWGEVRDHRLVSLCGTGHNTVHVALRYFEKFHMWPDWCVGRTRDLAAYGWGLYGEALLREQRT